MEVDITITINRVNWTSVCHWSKVFSQQWIFMVPNFINLVVTNMKERKPCSLIYIHSSTNMFFRFIYFRITDHSRSAHFNSNTSKKLKIAYLAELLLDILLLLLNVYSNIFCICLSSGIELHTHIWFTP